MGFNLQDILSDEDRKKLEQSLQQQQAPASWLERMVAGNPEASANLAKAKQELAGKTAPSKQASVAPGLTLDSIREMTGATEVRTMPDSPTMASSLRVNPQIAAPERKRISVPVEQQPAGELAKPQVAEAQPKEMKPEVKDFLVKKFGLDAYSPEKLKEAQGRAEEKKSGLGTAQFIAGLGDAIAGRNPQQSAALFDQYRKNIDESEVGAFEKQRKSAMENRSFELTEKKAQAEADLSDPNSKASIAFRESIKSNFPRIADSFGKNWDSVTAADQALIFKPLELKEQIEARKQTASILSAQRGDALKLKSEEKAETKKAKMFEIEDRRQNINAALTTLDKMIGDKGTYELFGSHNQDIDRLTEQIATDMAKLMDPSSVARPAEVEQIKATLVKPGFKNRNATAKEILNNFRSEVERRADGAYKIRGLEAPARQQSFPRTVRKGNQTATVSNEADLNEALQDGWN